MNIKYFSNSIQSIDQLKKEYRKLARKFHPDLNHDKDTTEDMKQINKEYEYLFATVETKKDNEQGHNVNDSYRTIINELLKHDNITIDLIGTWLWISGNTFPIKNELKKLGFRFQKTSKKWYLGEFTSKKKHKKSLSWSEKVKKYGKETLKSNNNSKPLLT